MLELKDICKTFNPNTINAKVALNHLNLTLNDGDFVTVIGGNGAGKSTMLNAIAGVFQVDSGTITIDGQDVTKLPEHKGVPGPHDGHRAHHADRGKSGAGSPPGPAPRVEVGYHCLGAGRLQRVAENAGSGA